MRRQASRHRIDLAAATGIVLILVIVSACGASSQPVFPTLRPTETPSPEPSQTPSPAFTAAAASATPVSAQTLTAGPSATSVVGLVITQPRSTLTSTPYDAQSGDLQIEYFTTNASTVKPGDTLTLFWSVKGVETATLYRLDASGKRKKIAEVERTGTLDVKTLDTDRDVVQFMLTIGDAASHVEQSLAVPVTCPEVSVFDPHAEGCAQGPSTASAEVEQTFEHGTMIWVQVQLRIYVLFDDGRQPAWASYPDDFKDGQPANDPSLSPPAALRQPVRGFGLVWRTQPGVRDRLGWATASEAPFDGEFQGDATVEGGQMYLRARDGKVLALSSKGTSWKWITP